MAMRSRYKLTELDFRARILYPQKDTVFPSISSLTPEFLTTFPISYALSPCASHKETALSLLFSGVIMQRPIPILKVLYISSLVIPPVFCISLKMGWGSGILSR